MIPFFTKCGLLVIVTSDTVFHHWPACFHNSEHMRRCDTIPFLLRGCVQAAHDPGLYHSHLERGDGDGPGVRTELSVKKQMWALGIH